jgi:hypothetical protein
MPFEPTDRGNPYQLTKNQHIHSAHSIGKFYDSNGTVEVRILAENKDVRRKKNDKIFVAKRVWDQRAEKGYMYEIETNFHREIDFVRPFGQRNHDAISKYFVLWRERFKFNLIDSSDALLEGVSGDELSKSEEEGFESKYMMYVRNGGVVPSRFATGFFIQREIDCAMQLEFNGVEWGVVEAVDGEFLVADCYVDCLVMPISPSLAFVANEFDRKINREQLAAINNLSMGRANKFVFARNLAACPVATNTQCG